ncbi:hypothetical protein AABB24_017148, partial [Solanum stoloniferum]
LFNFNFYFNYSHPFISNLANFITNLAIPILNLIFRILIPFNLIRPSFKLNPSRSFKLIPRFRSMLLNLPILIPKDSKKETLTLSFILFLSKPSTAASPISLFSGLLRQQQQPCCCSFPLLFFLLFRQDQQQQPARRAGPAAAASNNIELQRELLYGEAAAP